MRTVDEKLKYNKERETKSDFAWGYVQGVNFYRLYPKCDAEGRKIIKRGLDDWAEMARLGHADAKGYMCGVRDAANERKAKKNK